MADRYLFNTSGDYVAFVVGSNLFSPSCEWIGFVPQANEVYHPDGQFLGYITDDDRVFCKRSERRMRSLRPLKPLRPLRPLKPLRRLRMMRPPYPYTDYIGR